MPKIGKRLRELRKEKKLTQLELANKLELSKTAILQYENNKREPNFDSLMKICDFFKVSAQYLRDESEYKKLSEDRYFNTGNEIREQINFLEGDTKQYSISIMNSFNSFIEDLLRNDDGIEKDSLLKSLYHTIDLISRIYGNSYRYYIADIYEENLSELELYIKIEKVLRKEISNLESEFIDIFNMSSKNFYSDYIKHIEINKHND